ncbi:UDP-N-acetylglucosamine 1-carboxyvinyltransferase 2 [compost metagenome]
MIIAGLVADGTTEVTGTHHIDRGYVHLAEKLSGLGADIWRITEGKEAVAEKTTVPAQEELPLFKVQPTWA